MAEILPDTLKKNQCMGLLSMLTLQTRRRLMFEAIGECGRIMTPLADEGAISQVSGEWVFQGGRARAILFSTTRYANNSAGAFVEL